MRPLKFRIWDEERQGFCPPFEPFSALGASCIWFPKEREYSVEQFTGLLDKNGKEIYEGDIVECFGPREPVVVEYRDGGFGYSIKYDFIWFGHNYHFKWHDGRSENIVIVGNIHETPELMPKEPA